jgi:hypothetical protein
MRVRRQQRRAGLGFVQVLDDRHRLRQARAIVQLQHRHELVGGHSGVGVFPVIAFGQVHRQVFVGQPFQVERDTHAKRGGGTEVVVELHGGAFGQDLRSLRG